MQNKALTDTLDYLVKALCADYKRREDIILGGMAERRVDNELRYLNFKLFDAAAEVVGDGKAGTIISEIGSSVGFAKSEFEYISEGIYKQYKMLVKQNIAKRLYLK